MSFIGLNRYEISLFFLTWRRQLEAKRVPWMMGSLEVQRWPSSPVISVNPNSRAFFFYRESLNFHWECPKLSLEKIAINIDSQTRVGIKVRRVESRVKSVRGCPPQSVIKINNILM